MNKLKIKYRNFKKQIVSNFRKVKEKLFVRFDNSQTIVQPILIHDEMVNSETIVKPILIHDQLVDSEDIVQPFRGKQNWIRLKKWVKNYFVRNKKLIIQFKNYWIKVKPIVIKFIIGLALIFRLTTVPVEARGDGPVHVPYAEALRTPIGRHSRNCPKSTNPFPFGNQQSYKSNMGTGNDGSMSIKGHKDISENPMNQNAPSSCHSTNSKAEELGSSEDLICEKLEKARISDEKIEQKTQDLVCEKLEEASLMENRLAEETKSEINKKLAQLRLEEDKIIEKSTLGDDRLPNKTTVTQDLNQTNPETDKSLMEIRKEKALELRDGNATVDSLLQEIEKKHQHHLSKLTEKKSSIIINHADNISVQRPDLDKPIIVSQTQLTRKSYHADEIGIQPDPHFNKTQVKAFKNFNKRNKFLEENFNKTIGKDMTDYVTDVLNNPNNPSVAVQFNYNRNMSRNHPEWIEKGLIILDMETLNGIVCVQDRDNANQYVVKTVYPFDEELIHQVLRKGTIQ